MPAQVGELESDVMPGPAVFDEFRADATVLVPPGTQRQARVPWDFGVSGSLTTKQCAKSQFCLSRQGGFVLSRLGRPYSSRRCWRDPAPDVRDNDLMSDVGERFGQTPTTKLDN
jgi:hypothetical protein